MYNKKELSKKRFFVTLRNNVRRSQGEAMTKSSIWLFGQFFFTYKVLV